MTNNFDELQKFGKEQFEAAGSVAASLTKGLQVIAAEATEFSKKSIAANSAHVEQLMGAASLEAAIQIQSEYAARAYDTLIAQATKIGELYVALAKEAFKPLQNAFASLQSINGAGAPIAK